MPAAAEKILRLFREHPIQTPTGPLHVSVSIGGIGFPSLVQTAHEAMTRAETAMQDAKRQGRDSFSLYLLSEDQSRDTRREMAVGEGEKEALERTEERWVGKGGCTKG